MTDTTDTTSSTGAAGDRMPATMGLRFLQGMAMGGADVIPGVSGGTVALILGIYARLIAAIRSLSSAPIALLRGDGAAARAHAAAVPWAFVLPVGFGLLTALGIGSIVLPPLLEDYPVQTSALFFGLIVASLSVPWAQARAAVAQGRGGDRVEGGLRSLLGIAAVMAVVAFLIMGLPELVVDDPPLLRVFLSATVAICAMILPGVSGAFLLLALGIYEPTLEALSDRNLAYVGTFVLGAIVGLGSFARLLSYLLDRHLAITMAALTGLMLGALRRLWPWGGAEGHLDAPPDLAGALVAFAFAAVGVAAVRLLLAAGRQSLADA